jgi:hypothetical protein
LKYSEPKLDTIKEEVLGPGKKSRDEENLSEILNNFLNKQRTLSPIPFKGGSSGEG